MKNIKQKHKYSEFINKLDKNLHEVLKNDYYNTYYDETKKHFIVITGNNNHVLDNYNKDDLISIFEIISQLILLPDVLKKLKDIKKVNAVTRLAFEDILILNKYLSLFNSELFTDDVVDIIFDIENDIIEIVS